MGIQFCSCSVAIIYATCNVTCHVECFVLLYQYFPPYARSAQYGCFLWSLVTVLSPHVIQVLSE